MSCYEAKIAIGSFEEPLLPEDSYVELLERAFDERILTSTGHPVIQKLMGVV